MGYKIWRKDNQGWDLAYDTVFETREKADEHIASLNAQWADMVKYGELLFYPYREDIKLDRNGQVIDETLKKKIYKPKPLRKLRKRKKP